ncbi:MAG: DUF2829 domain-containing protein [Tannerellaceae bacterium]
MTADHNTLARIINGVERGHSFSLALSRIKQGAHYTREEWGSSGEWITMDAERYRDCIEHNKARDIPEIMWYDGVSVIEPWTPTYDDLTHNDWYECPAQLNHTTL